MLQPGKDFAYFNPLAEVEMLEANLPHWHQVGALYFVTFRLSDSIPQEKLHWWKNGFELWLARNPKPWDLNQIDEYQTHFARKIECGWTKATAVAYYESVPTRKLSKTVYSSLTKTATK
jgi:hypothetical protein